LFLLLFAACIYHTCVFVCYSASEMTYIVSGGAINSTHTLIRVLHCTAFTIMCNFLDNVCTFDDNCFFASNCYWLIIQINVQTAIYTL